MTESQTRRQKWLACALLGAAILAVYSQALQCTFVNIDDQDYVTWNTDIQHGLNWRSIQWAFTTGHASNWHPVTWLSHTLDCQLYGLAPVGHHLTSLLLHLANSVLLLLLLNRMTGSLWRSAWVAAVFALHPLRVESVAWVAERKDVLSTFFWMLTVGAYARYADRLKSQNSNYKWFYGLALVFFALGLMSKPMLVTLPFVLLLLDWWPLGRWKFGPGYSWRLIVEKIPFLLLAGTVSVITFFVQTRSSVAPLFSKVSLDERLANIPVAYARYLGKIFWPSGLAVFYGYEHWKFNQVAGAVFLLAFVTAWVIWQWRARPYLAVGWFWFMGGLAPTIGLVQVGHQAMADRYSYIPSVGISIMAAWGLCDLVAGRPRLLKAASTFGVLALAVCAVLTPRQIAYWKNPVVLFAHAADLSDQDCLTCYNIGCAVMEEGNFPRAVRCFERALKVADKSIPPSFLARVENNLGCAFLGEGQITNAVVDFEKALAIQPRYPEAYYNMGRAFLAHGQPDVAVDCFQHALALDQNPHILSTLAEAYARMGQFTQAADAAQRARQLALDQNNRALAGALESQLRRYQSGKGVPRP